MSSLLLFGSNAFGQSSVNGNQTPEPTIVEFDQPVIDIQCTLAANILLMADRTLLGWGLIDGAEIPSPKQTAASVEHVACGWSRIILIDHTGMMGHLTITKHSSEPFANGVQTRLCHVACHDGLVVGANETSLYIWNSALSAIPRQVTLSVAVTQVACGQAHCLCLTADGNVLSWGMSQFGQCGHGDAITRETPQVIEAIDGICIAAVAAGGWHSALLSQSHDLYLMGWNKHGQLGIAIDAMSVSMTPSLLETNDDINFLHVACGGSHTVASDSLDRVFTWGCNSWGQLGLDGEGDRASPVQLPITRPTGRRNIKQLACGPWHTCVLYQ